MIDENTNATNELLRQLLAAGDGREREQTAILNQIQLDLALINQQMDFRQVTIRTLENKDLEAKKEIETIKKEANTAALEAAKANERLNTLWKANAFLAITTVTAIIGLIVKSLGAS